MTLSSADLSHLIAALILLLAAAHGCSDLFRRFRQPPVLGGLLLGPTALTLGFALGQGSFHGCC